MDARFCLAFMECFVGRIDVAFLEARQCRRCGSRTVGHLKVPLPLLITATFFGALSVRH